MLLLAFATGMRQGEIRALHWGDVDLEKRMIVVRRGMSLEEPAVAKAGYHRGPRVVALTDAATRELRDLRNRRPEGQDLVFATRNGTPIMRANMSRWMRAVMKDAVQEGVRPGLTFHNARHTFATMARRARVDSTWIANQLGHHSPSYTDRQYVHFDVMVGLDVSWAEFEAEESAPSAPSVLPGSLGDDRKPVH